MMNPKKGLAFVVTGNDVAEKDSILLGEPTGASWYYSWSPRSPVKPENEKGAEFVPMLWDSSQYNWATLLNEYPASYTGWIMGPNEPNLGSQSNMSPVEAAICWHQLRESYPSAKLLSPACWDRPILNTKTDKWEHEGDHWLSAWIHEYWLRYKQFPNPDAWSLHYYSGRTPAAAVERFYKEWVLKNDDRGGIKVWLTEFRFCHQWLLDVPGNDLAKYMRKQFRLLDYMPYLERYAYFANRNCDPIITDGCDIALCDDNGLTDMGRVFMWV